MAFTKIRNSLFPQVRKAARDKFRQRLFVRNNLMILIISGFLVVEQLYYSVYVSSPGTQLQSCYNTSALLMIIFFIISLYFQWRKPACPTRLHEIFPPALVFTGMLIALIRFTSIEFDPAAFRIPTVFIAVLYGSSVIWVIYPWLSVSLYGLLSLSSIGLMLAIHPEIVERFYVADIISNTIIALLVSLLNYRNYVKQFIANEIIERKNSSLVQKNQEIKRINSQLKALSEQDELTNLHNRRKINNILIQHAEETLQKSTELSVILLDIDNFKDINDNHGHATGDLVLEGIARILEKSIRETDSCGRWGGEEFIVICPAINCSEAALLAERLRQQISRHSFFEQISVTASFGVSSLSEQKSIDHLLQMADQCLYCAKNKGRNRVVFDTSQEISSTANQPITRRVEFT